MPDEADCQPAFGQFAVRGLDVGHDEVGGASRSWHRVGEADAELHRTGRPWWGELDNAELAIGSVVDIQDEEITTREGKTDPLCAASASVCPVPYARSKTGGLPVPRIKQGATWLDYYR